VCSRSTTGRRLPLGLRGRKRNWTPEETGRSAWTQLIMTEIQNHNIREHQHINTHSSHELLQDVSTLFAIDAYSNPGMAARRSKRLPGASHSGPALRASQLPCGRWFEESDDLGGRESGGASTRGGKECKGEGWVIMVWLWSKKGF